jgi:sulfatase modifying factor 1
VSGQVRTEAEWEKAAKGGQLGREFPWGNYLGLDSGIDSRDYANYAGIGGPDVWENTSPVRSFLPNDYGLFDIIGNAYEWCSDYYGFFYYTEFYYTESVTNTNNPEGPPKPMPPEVENRVLRGGSCYDGFFPSYLRSATRYSEIGIEFIVYNVVLGKRALLLVIRKYGRSIFINSN